MYVFYVKMYTSMNLGVQIQHSDKIRQERNENRI